MSNATPTGPRAAAVARNALTGGGRFVVSALLALVVTPYLLAQLGGDAFGLWALAGATVSVVRLLDLGLGRSMTRAVAAESGRGRPTAALEDLATGRAVMLGVGVIVVLCVWLARDALASTILRVPVALLPEARYVLVGAAAVGAVEGLFTPARAALDGVGRMDLNNGIDTVQRVASAAGVFIVLHLGWGLEGLIWKNLVLALAAGAVYHVALRRTVAGLSGFELAVERRRLRELAAFGRHIQVINLSGVAVEVGSKMVLSRIAGLPAVAAYEVASRVTGQIGGALLAAASALFPAAAEVRSAARVSVSALAHRAAAAGSRVEHRLVELCRRATTYTGWLALPTYALLAVLAQDFVNAWLGPGYEPVARALIVLALGWILAVLSAPAHMVAQAGGQVRASTAAAAATTVVAVGGAALLVRPRGLEGVVAAQSLGLAAGAVLMWVLFCRGFNCGWRDLGLPRWRPIAAAVAGAVLARLVVAQLSPSLLTLAVAAGAGLALYGGAMLASREVSEVEAELARQVLRRPTSQRSGAPNETRRGAATDATAEPLAGLVVEHDEAAGDTPAKPPDEDGSPCG